MKEIIPDIDKLFKDAVDKHTDVPSDRVWDAIENNLDKKTVVHITQRYDRLKKVAVILLLLLGGITTYLIISPKISNNKNNTVTTPTNQDKLRGTFKNSENNTKAKIDQQPQESIETTLTDNDSRQDKVTTPDMVSGSDLSAIAGQHNFKKEQVVDHSNSSDINSSPIEQIKKTLLIKINNSRSNMAFTAQGGIIVPAPTNPAGNHVKNAASIFDHNTAPQSYSEGKMGNMTINNFLLMPTTPFIQDGFLKDYQSTSKAVATLEQAKDLTPIKSKKYSSGISSRLSLALYYCPDLSFNHLRNDHPHGPDNDRHHLKDNERHTFSYTSGVTMDYKITNHFSIQTGVAYSQNNIDNQPKDIVAEKDNHGDVKYRFDASCGFGYFVPHSGPPPGIGDTLRGVSSQNNLKYVDIPIAVTYSITKGKLSLSALAGVSLNTLISGTLNTSVNNNNIKESQTITTVEGLKKYSATGLIGAGVDYRINKLISVGFTPTARIALTSINNGSAVKSYPNTLGLSTGLKLHL